MLAILTLAAAVATPARPGELKSFGDWTIGCDNGRACTAISLMEMESGENQLTVEISREADPLATVQLRIPNIEQAAPGAAVELLVDKDTALASVNLPKDGGPLLMTADPALIARLTNGQRLTLMSAQNGFLGTTSLNGLAAALDYMDRQQQRAGTVTALVLKGEGPANLVPKPPALPVLPPWRQGRADTLVLAEQDVQSLQARTGCDANGDAPLPLEASRLDGRNWLALLPCGSSPYNIVTTAVLISGKGKARRMKPAAFDILPGLGQADGPPLLSNAAWDPQAGELVSFAKGRGLGDCGSAETYIWDGRRFRLVTQVAMAECRGVLDWIPTWRATVKRR
ncbi:MAG: DUF1176 domain-containing protein [Chakrabartia sp.]